MAIRCFVYIVYNFYRNIIDKVLLRTCHEKLLPTKAMAAIVSDQQKAVSFVSMKFESDRKTLVASDLFSFIYFIDFVFTLRYEQQKERFDHI